MSVSERPAFIRLHSRARSVQIGNPAMKPKPAIDPLAAFPDSKRQPTDADLETALGRSFGSFADVLSGVARAHPDAITAWQYSNQAGWYRISILKKRRLFYLVPKQGDFRLSLIVGGKAIASLKQGPHAAELERRLKTAKRYPEGTAFEFGPIDCDAALVLAMIEAKLAR